jgi:hypothetical protein
MFLWAIDAIAAIPPRIEAAGAGKNHFPPILLTASQEKLQLTI